MNLVENIAETTGIGLGVHTVIYPRRDRIFRLRRPEGRRRVLHAGDRHGEDEGD